MSIEKFLNEVYDNEPVMEAVDAVTIVGLLLLAVGVVVTIKDGIKEGKDIKAGKPTRGDFNPREAAAEKAKRKAEALQKKEEVLKKYNTSDEDVATEKIVKHVVSDVNKMVTKVRQDPKVKEKIKSSVDKFKAEYTKDDASYTIKCEPEEMSKSGGYLLIIDADQMLRVELMWIVHDIIEALEIKYHDEKLAGLVSFNFGDGDEGCLYINY